MYNSTETLILKRGDGDINNQVYIKIVISFLSLLAALVSLKLRVDSNSMRHLRFLPRVNSYYAILDAIHNLNNLTNSDNQRTIRFSLLTSKNRGFKELVKLLKESHYISGDIDALQVIENNSVAINQPVGRRSLRSKKGIYEEVIIHDIHDPKTPFRELKEMADKFIQRAIIDFISCLCFLIFILSIILSLL